ncbi:hypothetical protein [Polymorphospora sp. NPDC050346]|uniref:hypothetical protein n=1 Tax=Polymorphospora sp. NPDC050346 TaxID=3155780 RepID=UPI0033C492A4
MLVTAPVTSRQRALANLYASVSVLDRLLPGPVSEHAELLREAMRWLPGAVVTIEWWADDAPHARASAILGRALAVFDLGPDAGGSNLDALRAATGLLLHRPPVSAPLPLDQKLTATDHQVDLPRMLGQSHMRMLLWETPF